MHSDRASAKVPQRAPRIKKSTVHFRRQRLPRGRERFRPCRWRKPGRPVGPAGGRPPLGGSDVDAICRNRGCITDVREERERKTLAVGAAQERRTASTPPAGACARRPPALRLRGRLRRPGSPALSRARPGRRRLRRPDPARARRRPPTGAGHAARPGSGRRPARHPGPHPGGQLGGPARRGDAGLRATARRRAAARRRSVGGGARCATCAAGRKRWRSSATACAPIRPSPPSPPASP